MNPTEQALWTRLEAYPLDQSGDALSFLARLARDNRWTHAFARRAIGEYKRFVFLAMAAGHPVTPSDQVDQVWHLHLLYTRSYWEEFCPQVLGAPLHHGPTRGGRAEGAKFEDWYARTLASYRRHFNGEPPADLWPDSRRRFGRDLNFARVSVGGHWIIPRPVGILDTLRRAALGWLAAVACLLGSAPAAQARESLAAATAPWNPLDFRGPQFLAFYGCLLGGAFLATVLWRTIRRSMAARQVERQASFPEDREPDLDAAEVALLAGGEKRAINAAIVVLVRRGSLTVEADGSLSQGRVTGQNPQNSAFENAVSAAAPQARGPHRLPADAAVGKALEAMRGHLQALGLMLSPEWSVRLGWEMKAILAVPLLVGIAKIAVGMSRDKPVGFLVGCCLINAFLVIFFDRPAAAATPRGERLLGRWRERHSPLREASAYVAAQASPGDSAATMVALGVALFGASALANEATADPLRQMLYPPNAGGADGSSSWGDSGGGGGDGGGGDGGGGGCGGGGCGGCGGGGD